MEVLHPNGDNMIRFIQLTDEMGMKFLLGVWHIETIIPLHDGRTNIILASGREIIVVEEGSVVEERIVMAVVKYG